MKPKKSKKPNVQNLWGKVEKVKLPRNMEESKLQEACMDLFKLMYPEYYQVYFSIPNGGKLPRATAITLLKEGRKPGVWDTFLSVPRQGWCGMFIEYKVGYNTLTEEQEQFEQQVRHMYKCVVVRSRDEFAREIQLYLGKSKRVNYGYSNE